MNLKILYTHINVIYMVMQFNKGKYTEYQEIKIYNHSESKKERTQIESDIILDNFDEKTKIIIKMYINKIDIDPWATLSDMIKKLKTKYNIPDSFDNILDQLTKQNVEQKIINNENNFDHKEISNEIIHLLSYFGYDFFVNLELGIFLYHNYKNNIINVIEKYENLFTNANKHVFYSKLIEAVELYLRKNQIKIEWHRIQETTINGNIFCFIEMPAYLIFKHDKSLLFEFLMNCYLEILETTINTVDFNISKNFCPRFDENYKMYDLCRRLNYDYNIYWINIHKPNRIYTESFYEVKNCKTLYTVLDNVKTSMTTALTQTLPIVLFFDTGVKDVIMETMRNCIQKISDQTPENIKENIQLYMFKEIYGSSDTITNIANILNAIETEIYESMNSRYYNFNNIKKCLFLTVVLNNSIRDANNDLNDFLISITTHNEALYKEIDFLESVFTEFDKNYEKTISNIFNSLNKDICNVIQTNGNRFYEEDNGIAEEYRNIIFCYNNLYQNKLKTSTISKENILCDQNDWYNKYAYSICLPDITNKAMLLTNETKEVENKIQRLDENILN